MYLYKIYGMIVESDIELGEAYECRESAYAQVSIRYADMQEEIGRIEETIRTGESGMVRGWAGMECL